MRIDQTLHPVHGASAILRCELTVLAAPDTLHRARKTLYYQLRDGPLRVTHVHTGRPDGRGLARATLAVRVPREARAALHGLIVTLREAAHAPVMCRYLPGPAPLSAAPRAAREPT